MIASAALILAGLALPAHSVLAAVNPITRQSRELSFAMRQMYEREAYQQVEAVPNPPQCSSGYDTQTADGQCECGPGRVQVTPGTCGVANGGGMFNTVQLDEPEQLSIPITWSDSISGPGNVMNAAQCGGICSQDSECIGYYLTPAAASGTAYCWQLGNSYVFDSPANDAPPFIPNSGSRMARRASAGATGAIGAPGGILGAAQQAQAPGSSNPTTGCNPALGDYAPPNLGPCQCGPGRVSDGNGGCKYAPSAGTRLTRRVARDTEAQW